MLSYISIMVLSVCKRSIHIRNMIVVLWSYIFAFRKT